MIVVSACVLLAVALAACRTTYNFGAVSFADAQHGWVTGWNATTSRSVVSVTTDGGATWAQTGARKAPAHIVGWVAFGSPTTGVWCVGINKLLYTTTGGQPWRRAIVRGIDGYFTAAAFVTADTGWASGVHGSLRAGGAVAKTTDGGANWRVQKCIRGKNGSGGFVDVVATSVQRCYALKSAARGGVWVTADGGATWARQELPGATRKISYRSLDFPSDLAGRPSVTAAGSPRRPTAL